LDQALQRLSDENDVRRLAIRMSNGMDFRDYAMFRECWADEVDLDIPALAGDAVALSGILSGDDYARGVIDLLTGFKATQHLSTNHDVVVEGDEASCTCYTHATHLLPVEDGEPWHTIGARYDIVARRMPAMGWRIVKFTWTRLWSDGNPALWQEAARRVRALRG
jgi:SnoaL-like domain